MSLKTFLRLIFYVLQNQINRRQVLQIGIVDRYRLNSFAVADIVQQVVESNKSLSESPVKYQ